MLHAVSEDGGTGFCHAGMPALLPTGYHGPLIVALDSNILIDMQQHGNTLLDGGVPQVGEPYRAELLALGSVLDIWLMRDIRFIATPRSRTDGGRTTDHVLAKRERAIEALGETLAFQYSDWAVVAPADFEDLHEYGTIDGVPEGADRDLLAEAQSVGAHVFLTRDRAVLGRAVVHGRPLAVMSPSALLDQLVYAGVQLFGGGFARMTHARTDAFVSRRPILVNGAASSPYSRTSSGCPGHR